MARDITKVIRDIIKHVPDPEGGMRCALERIHDRVAFTAPEIMRQRWSDLSYVVNRYCPGYEDLTAWQKRCVAILMDQPAPKEITP